MYDTDRYLMYRLVYMQRLLALLLTVPLFTVSFISLPSQAVEPGFDCGDPFSNDQLNSTERTICFETDLSLLDARLTEIYQQLDPDLSEEPYAIPNLRESQRAWVSQRDECIYDNCLRKLYLDRILELESLRGTIYQDKSRSDVDGNRAYEGTDMTFILRFLGFHLGIVYRASMVDFTSMVDFSDYYAFDLHIDENYLSLEVGHEIIDLYQENPSLGKSIVADMLDYTANASRDEDISPPIYNERYLDNIAANIFVNWLEMFRITFGHSNYIGYPMCTRPCNVNSSYRGFFFAPFSNEHLAFVHTGIGGVHMHPYQYYDREYYLVYDLQQEKRIGFDGLFLDSYHPQLIEMIIREHEIQHIDISDTKWSPVNRLRSNDDISLGTWADEMVMVDSDKDGIIDAFHTRVLFYDDDYYRFPTVEIPARDLMPFMHPEYRASFE